MRLMSGVVLGSVIWAVFFSTASPQTSPIISQPTPDSPVGARNENAPAGFSQYDFLIGDWDAEVIFYPAKGEPLNYMAKWHNIWVVNGTVVFQEWRGPHTTGAEFRNYNPQENYWDGRNIYSGRDWYQTISKWNEETKEMTVHRKMTGPRGEHLNEEIYYDISQEIFKIRTRKSFDDGKTWKRGNYELTATRVK